MFFYAYSHIQSLYPVQKLAESKYKSFLETILFMRAGYDTSIGSEQQSDKINLFSKFLVVDDK